MSDKMQLLLEAERRGILPEGQKAALTEARRRGLVPGGEQPEAPQQEQSLFQGLSRAAQQGATFGFADEIGGAGAATAEFVKSAGSDIMKGQMPSLSRAMSAGGDAYSQTVGDIRGGVEGFRETNPIASTAAEVVGGLGGTAGASQLVGKALGPVKAGVSAALKRGTLEGGLYGSVYGAGSGEGGADRLQRAAAGAGTGALAGGAMGAVGGALGNRAARKTIPGFDDLKKQAGQFYDDAERAGVRLSQTGYASVVDDLEKAAEQATFRAGLHPRVNTALKEIKGFVGQEQTLGQLEQARRVLGVAARSPEVDERRVAVELIDALDDAIGRLSAKDVVAGDPGVGSKALKTARDLWRRSKKAETIETLIDRAGTRAGQFSGSGYENALRTEFRQIAMNPKRMRGFSEAERAAIKKVANGGSLENLFRYIGKAAPTGIVSGAMGTGAGYMIGGGLGAFAIPAAGLAGRSAATAMTGANARLASDLMRAGGTLPQQAIGGGMQALTAGTGILGAQRGPELILGPRRPAQSQVLR